MARSKVLVIGVLCALVAITYVMLPTGESTLRIRDARRKGEGAVKARLLPFRSGALRIHARGTIEGTARLHIYSNQDRDYRTVDVAGEMNEEVFAESEAWVGDLRVIYEPLTAKSGSLVLLLTCGR
jgi:hypothetical protein